MKDPLKAEYNENLKALKENAKEFLNEYSASNLLLLSTTKPVTEVLKKYPNHTSVEGKYFQQLILPLLEALMHNLEIYYVRLKPDFEVIGSNYPLGLKNAALEAILEQHICCFRQVLIPRRSKTTVCVSERKLKDATSHDVLASTSLYVEHWRVNQKFYLSAFTKAQWRALYEFVGLKNQTFVNQVLAE